MGRNNLWSAKYFHNLAAVIGHGSCRVGVASCMVVSMLSSKNGDIPVTGTGGGGILQMVSVETASDNMCVPNPINKWTGGRYFLSNSSREGFQKVVEC